MNNNKTFQDTVKWQKERRSKVKDLTVNIEHCPNKKLKDIKENRNKTSYTWIGHSTFFIQLNGLNILTDPVWAKTDGLSKKINRARNGFRRLA